MPQLNDTAPDVPALNSVRPSAVTMLTENLDIFFFQIIEITLNVDDSYHFYGLNSN